MNKIQLIKKTFVICLCTVFALSFQSCYTTAIVSGTIKAQKEKKQKKERITSEILSGSKTRSFAKPYNCGEWEVGQYWDGDKKKWRTAKGTGSARRRFKKTVEELGHFYIYDADYMYYIPKSEYEDYKREVEYESVGIGSNDRLALKGLKGSDFKSVGSAYLYERSYSVAGYGIFSRVVWQDKFVRVDRITWTGNVANGMLDGAGEGYVVTKDQQGNSSSWAVSGSFKKGVPEKALIRRLNGKRGGDRYTLSVSNSSAGLYICKVEGQASKSDNIQSAADDTQSKLFYSFFINKNLQQFSPRFNAIKQDFANGKSVVTYRGMDIVIDNKLEFVSIAESAVKIPRNYFGDAFFANVTSITIPKSVTHVEDFAFYNHQKLVSVNFLGPIGDISNSAFENCRSLRKIDLSKWQTDLIGAQTFKGCGSLESVILPKTLKVIGEEAFYGCSSLKSVTLPNTLRKICKRAFQGCSSLKSITIPSSVNEILDYAFRECSSLTSASLLCNPNRGKAVFYGCGLSAVNIKRNGKMVRDTNSGWFNEPQSYQASSSSSNISVPSYDLRDWKFSPGTKPDFVVKAWSVTFSDGATGLIYYCNSGHSYYSYGTLGIPYKTLDYAIKALYFYKKRGYDSDEGRGFEK